MTWDLVTQASSTKDFLGSGDGAHLWHSNQSVVINIAGFEIVESL